MSASVSTMLESHSNFDYGDNEPKAEYGKLLIDKEI